MYICLQCREFWVIFIVAWSQPYRILSRDAVTGRTATHHLPHQTPFHSKFHHHGLRSTIRKVSQSLPRPRHLYSHKCRVLRSIEAGITPKTQKCHHRTQDGSPLSAAGAPSRWIVKLFWGRFGEEALCQLKKAQRSHNYIRKQKGYGGLCISMGREAIREAEVG